jgi:hypothetical protein
MCAPGFSPKELFMMIYVIYIIAFMIGIWLTRKYHDVNYPTLLLANVAVMYLLPSIILTCLLAFTEQIYELTGFALYQI